jgi:hypothetical protein
MLVIDEIHAMLSGTFREQRIFLNCLRFLANDLHLPLGCVGTNEAKLLSRGRTPCVDLYLNRRLRSQVIHDLNTVIYCTQIVDYCT